MISRSFVQVGDGTCNTTSPSCETETHEKLSAITFCRAQESSIYLVYQGSTQNKQNATHTFFSRSQTGGLLKPSKNSWDRRTSFFSIRTKVTMLRFWLHSGLYRSVAPFSLFCVFPCILIITFLHGFFSPAQLM